MLLLSETVYTRLEKHPFVVVRSEGFSPLFGDAYARYATVTPPFFPRLEPPAAEDSRSSVPIQPTDNILDGK
jgi:hypothetical protein